MTFVKEIVVAELITEEAARDVDFLASYDDDLLAIQDLLGYNGGQPTKKVTLAVNDDRGGRNGGHGESEKEMEKMMS